MIYCFIVLLFLLIYYFKTQFGAELEIKNVFFEIFNQIASTGIIQGTELIHLQSDSELLVESYSEGEEESISTLRRLPSCSNMPDDMTAPVAAVEIRSLIERKEELERRQRKQDRHRQRVQVSIKAYISYYIYILRIRVVIHVSYTSSASDSRNFREHGKSVA